MPANFGAHRWRRQRRGAVGPVDVHPEAAPTADRGHSGEVVDDAEIGGAGGRRDREHSRSAVRLQRRGQRLAGQPSARVGRHTQDLHVHHLGGGVDRRVGLLGGGHTGTARVLGGASPGLARRHQRRQVADRAAGDEAAAGRLRHAGQVGQPAQRLVLGVDRARPLQPAAAVDRRGADDQVEQRRQLGRGGRDERQVARVIDRHRGRRQRLGEDAQRLRGAEAVGSDRRAGLGGQLLAAARAVQRHRVQAQAVADVGEQGLGDPLGRIGVAVH